MNTIEDLNVAANVTYNNEASYAISFGTNLGNTTANVDAYTTANITKQTSLNSITDAVRDLLIDVQFSNVGNVSMAYTGTYSNIGLLQIAPAAWRVNGIRSVPQYNEAFANVKYSDLTGSSAISPEYSYITTVNDQSGNTRNWTTTVNVLVQPTITITGNLVYNEDTITNVTMANVAVDPASTTVFRMFANTVPTYGSMTDGVITGNSVFIDGNASSLNSQITAGGIKFWPASDFVSNVANAINIQLVSGTTTIGTANINIQIGSQDTDYTLTTSYGYAEDDTVQMVFDITDQDSRPNISYVSTFTQTSGPTSQFYVNGVAQGYGNAAVLANTKANINVANVSFLPYPDSTASVGLTYTQVKVMPTGNTTQASNVAISLTNTSSHDEYSLTTSYNFAEDAGIPLVYSITDTDTRAQSYNVTFTQTSGTSGQFVVNNALQGVGNAVILSNSKANINAANVTFLTYPDSTGNVAFTYNQNKVDVFGNTITQASNVAMTANCTSTHDEYTFATSGTYNEDDFLVFGNISGLISDTDPRATSYNISLSQSTGNVGKWYVNNAFYANSNVALNLSNTRANINSANIKFLSAVDATANLTFVYNQVKVNNAFGNITQAANVTGVYTCVTNPEISNMINRSYTSNTVNGIFSTSTPYINDGPDYGQTYTITLSSSLGKFGNSASNAVAASSYSFTGNTTQVNAQFVAMQFVPNTGPASTGTFTYTQSRDGVSQVNVSPTLTGSTGAAPSSTYTFTSSGTWTPSFDEYYYGNAQVMLIGGGGAGQAVQQSGGSSVFYDGAGGGGGGRDAIVTYIRGGTNNLTYGTYTITIGAGGARGTSVDASLLVSGGNGGQTSFSGPAGSSINYGYGGNGAAGTARRGGNSSPYTGGTSYGSTNPGFGGGGAGQSANGTNATASGPGNGGNGDLWPLVGIIVGGGGGGAGRFAGGTEAFGTNGAGTYGSGGRAGTGLPTTNNPAQNGQPGVCIIKFV